MQPLVLQPQVVALSPFGHSSPYLDDVLASLDRCVGLGEQVEVPVRFPLRATSRTENRPAPVNDEVSKGNHPFGSRPPSEVVEEDHGSLNAFHLDASPVGPERRDHKTIEFYEVSSSRSGVGHSDSPSQRSIEAPKARG